MDSENALLCEISILEKLLKKFPSCSDVRRYAENLQKGLSGKKKTSKKNFAKRKRVVEDSPDSYFIFNELKILRHCNKMNNTQKEIKYLEEVINDADRVGGYIELIKNNKIEMEYLYEVRPKLNKDILLLIEEFKETSVVVESVESSVEFRMFPTKEERIRSENSVLERLGFTRKFYLTCKKRNGDLEDIFFQKIRQTKQLLSSELLHRNQILGNGNTGEVKGLIDNDKEALKKFRRGELQKELLPYIEEFNLEIGETVSSEKSQLISRRLRKLGWDSKETSVAEAFRKMGYVEGKRK